MAEQTSMPLPPRSWQVFEAEYPDLAVAYDALSDACREAGPLDAHAVALVKLALSVGGHCQRTVHAHAKKALSAGGDVAFGPRIIISAIADGRRAAKID